MLIVTLFFIGFSFGSAALLLLGNILQRQEAVNLPARMAGLSLVTDLAILQSLHLNFLLGRFDAVHSSFYLVLLYGVAPCFFFYSRQLLTNISVHTMADTLHVFPLFLCALLPYHLALPGAFLLGSFYLLWLCKVVYSLRRQRQRFHLELLALGSLLAIAVAVIVLGFVWPLLDGWRFVSAYSILIGMAFFAVTLTMLRFPSLPGDVSEAVQAAYAESTLKSVDKQALLARLDTLMRKDKLYTIENLNLTTVAEQLDISPHQLSELINTELQQGFSRYVRQFRIEEAMTQLLNDPKASVLSIGLSVGFSTQSNFYAAFRDIAGMAPGQYRKLHAKRDNDLSS